MGNQGTYKVQRYFHCLLALRTQHRPEQSHINNESLTIKTFVGVIAFGDLMEKPIAGLEEYKMLWWNLYPHIYKNRGFGGD